MSNIIVTFEPCSASYVTVSTFSADHRRSSSFYISIPKLTRWFEPANAYAGSYVEMDCNNVVKISLGYNNTVTVRFYWTNVMFDDTIKGYVQTFDMQLSELKELIHVRQKTKYLASTNKARGHAKIILSESAHYQIARISKDKQKRRAFVKALKSNFIYGSHCHVELYGSWDSDFDFSTEGFNGGFVLHETTIKGFDSKSHKKLYYSVHT